VRELAPEGRAVRWSPDGSLALFESGAAPDIRTHVHAVDAETVREVAAFAGRAATASPDGARIAYLRISDTAELAAAREAEARALAARDGAALRAVRAEIARMEAEAAEVVVRDLATGGETVRDIERLRALSLAWVGNGTIVLVAQGPEGVQRTQLYRLAEGSAPEALTTGPGLRGAPRPAGRDRLLYTIDDDRFGVLDLATGREHAFEGASPSISADGSTVAWLARRPVDEEVRRGEAAVGADVRSRGLHTTLMAQRVGDGREPIELRSTTLPIADPTVSPNGDRVAYVMVERDSWDLYLTGTDGRGVHERFTREIQHEQFPRWVDDSRVMAMMGEFRHRRSYLYEVDRDRLGEIASDPLPGRDMRGRARLFHNNTLRTVAPQYEWVADRGGSRVLVVADRDGNTLSPSGVYVVDLDRPATREEVLARIDAQLATERELREKARRVFAPIEAEVRAVTREIEVGRIYDHAHALYQFGSKWFADPGSDLAIEYLAYAFRQMGYEPEIQWFEPRPGVRTANVVATLRGTERPDRIHVISSHFDSVEGSPGADDNSSGTTAMLEAARVLAARPQAETIRFALLGAEEAGLLGAVEFVRRAQAAGDDIASVINNDMLGWTRSHRLDNTIRYSNAEIRDLMHGGAILFSDLISYDSRYVRGTDAQVFWDAYGDIIGGVGAYPILGNPHYHQPHDILEVIDQRLVAEVSRTTTAAIMALASGLVDVEGARRD